MANGSERLTGDSERPSESPAADLDCTLLTEAQVAQSLGVGLSSIKRWRREGRGPSWVQLSPRALRYRRRDVVQWLDKVQAESESA